ncbi:uncharacterized protein [Anoplolepis gracilipes]|uniref:uncharacterized protein n=1 Tax=Anoplolepis gracilipes TaxID=354296 RepID=UPI003BA2D677
MVYIIETRFNLNRFFLLVVGLWPYKQSRLVQFQINLCSGFLTSFTIFQLTVFISAECTPDLVIKVLSFALLLITYSIEYYSFRLNIQVVKYLLEQLQHINNKLRDENELAIFKKYGDKAKRFTVIIIILYVFMSTMVGSITIIPSILGFILHINVTQPRVMKQLVPEYFISHENHFYLILLYMDIALFIGGTTLVGGGLMFLSYLTYACGMFRIASYRIEKAIMATKMPINIDLDKRFDRENEIIIFKEIIHAVHMHRKAIKYSLLILRSFQKSRFLLIIVMVLCLSLNLYGIAVNTSTIGDDIEQLLMHFSIATIMFLYLFFINNVGQEIMDHNNHVFFTAYNVQWYIAPLHIQKVILFLLQRGSKTVSLNFGGVISLSLELFATLLKASLSYFTVMYSMQE